MYKVTIGLLLLFFLLINFTPNNSFAQFSRIIIYTGDFGPSHGAFWIDTDNDGDLDIYITNGTVGSTMENFYYINNGDGTFTKNTTDAIVSEKKITPGGTWGDYDNDGDIDFYNTATAIFSAPNNLLYDNNGDGTFTQNSTAGDIINDADFGAACAWGDYNNDSYLDMFVVNGGVIGSGSALGNALYKSNANPPTITFTSQGGSVATTTNFAAGLAWADYDGDGDLDLFICSGGGDDNGTPIYNRLWRNNGDGTFTETNTTVFHTQQISEGASWGDYDNDGDLDLYVTTGTDWNGSPSTDLNLLYRNNGDGTFSAVNVTSIGLTEDDTTHSYGSAWGDYDNDGDLDLFVGNAQPTTENQVNYLFRNNGNGTFTRVTAGTVVTDTMNSRGCAWGDYDNDGDVDLLVVNHSPDDTNIIYRNDNNNGNHWINVELAGDGKNTNKSAIGSKVWATATINSTSVTQLREISSQTGYASQNSLRAHFGLGDATTVTTLTVEWLGGWSSSFSNVPADKFVQIFQIATNQTGTYVHKLGGASVEITSASSSNGAIAVWRYDTGPSNNTFSGSATSDDGTTVTPNVVASDRYWAVENDGLTGMTYTIGLDITNLPGVNNPQRLVIVKRSGPGSPWIPQNTTLSGNMLYAAGLTSFSEFTIASNSSDNSLPVELTNFRAISADQQVELIWTTQSEINNQGFIVERSLLKEGKFTEISSYLYNPDLRGQGNTNKRTDYSYIDRNVQNGVTYYYRIVDVDINGNKTYSKVVSATPSELSSGYFLFPNYPNPFNPETHIKFNVPARLEGNPEIQVIIYNTLGKVVRVLYNGQIKPGLHDLVWDGRDQQGQIVPSGVYFVHLKSDDFESTRKMLLTK